jgi:hypothetical protein
VIDNHIPRRYDDGGREVRDHPVLKAFVPAVSSDQRIASTRMPHSSQPPAASRIQAGGAAHAVASTGSPLQEQDYQEIRRAVDARRAVRKAEKVAKSSATTTLAIGTFSLLFVLFSPTWDSLMVVLGIFTVGVVEYLGCGKMRRAEPRAHRWLGYNQLAFLSLITLYCVIQMLTFSPETALSPEVREQLTMLPELSELIRELAPLVTYGFYSLVIVLSLGFQGGMALYYFTRGKHVERFNDATPAWIRRLFVEIGA